MEMLTQKFLGAKAILIGLLVIQAVN
jgi:hypothetical protein